MPLSIIGICTLRYLKGNSNNNKKLYHTFVSIFVRALFSMFLLVVAVLLLLRTGVVCLLLLLLLMVMVCRHTGTKQMCACLCAVHGVHGIPAIRYIDEYTYEESTQTVKNTRHHQQAARYTYVADMTENPCRTVNVLVMRSMCIVGIQLGSPRGLFFTIICRMERMNWGVLGKGSKSMQFQWPTNAAEWL